jgi:potassium voltage-gated channel Shal-related subfamily D member 2
MPSSSSAPTTDIALDALPFLNPQARFPDSPTIARHPRDGDHNHDYDHDDEEEVNAAAAGGGRSSSSSSRPMIMIISPPWRLHLYNLLERPNSSPAAMLVHVLVTVLITFSALVTILETVPAFHSLPGGLWFGLETSLVALFTVEYVARCAATSFSWSAFFGWVGCTFNLSLFFFFLF